MKLCNFISLLRLFSTFIILIILEINNKIKFLSILLILLIIFTCITDYLDGLYARKYSVNNNYIGKIMDHIFDKIFIISIFIKISISLSNNYLTLCIYLIIIRELLILGLREYILYIDKKDLFKIGIFGKTKTFIHMITIIYSTLILEFEYKNYYCIINVLVYISLVFSCISFYDYIKKYWKFLRNDF